jgi:mannose PTS system EIIA component
MVRILLVAHAPLASAFRQVAAHTFPDEAASLGVVDVLPTWDVERTQEAVVAQLGAYPTLVLVDVPGATPANAVAGLLSASPLWAAVHGLSVPMLWRVLSYRHEGLDALCERACHGGVAAIGRLHARH